MRFSKRHVLVLVPVLAACSNLPGEATSHSSSAVNPEQSINTETFKFTLSGVVVQELNGGGTEYAGIGSMLNGGSQTYEGCSLGAASAGMTLGRCTEKGTTQSSPTNGNLGGLLLSQTVQVTSESDVVSLALVLDNIEGASPATAAGSLGQNLNLAGNEAQAVGSLAGAAIVAAGSVGIGAILGAVGAALSLLGSAIGDDGAAEPNVSCGGGLVQTANPPFAITTQTPKPPSLTGGPWIAVPNSPHDTTYIQYTAAQLEALTASGPLVVQFPVSVQYPSTIQVAGAPPFTPATITVPITLAGDAPGYCNSSHLIQLTIARDTTKMDGPAADPLSGSTGVARTSTEVDGLVADSTHDGLANVQWTPGGWATGMATQSVYTPGVVTPTATLSRALPPPNNVLQLVPPVMNSDGSLKAGTGTTNLAWDIDSFWFDTAANLYWTQWTTTAGWSTQQLTSNPLFGVPNGRLTATSRTPGRMDVFWMNQFGNLMDEAYAGGSFAEYPNAIAGAAGPAGGGVAAVSRTYGVTDVLYIGQNGALYDTTYDGVTATTSKPLTSAGLAPPGAYVTAVARDANTLDAFFVGNPVAGVSPVYQMEFNSIASLGNPPSWQGPTALPGGSNQPGAPITAVSRSQAMIDLVYENNQQLEFIEFGANDSPTWSRVPALIAGAQASPNADLSIVASDDTHLALYYRDLFNNQYTATWAQPGPWTVSKPVLPSWKWHGWDTASGGLISDPALAAPNAAQLATAATGPDGTIWYEVFNGSAWPGWRSLGNDGTAFTDGPALVAVNGKLDVFVRDPRTSHLLHQEGTCESATSCVTPTFMSAGWEDLGGTLIPGTPTVVVSQPNNQINLFATWTDGSAHTIKGSGYGVMGPVYIWNGPPGGFGYWELVSTGFWTNLSGGVLDEPGAVSWGPNRLDVFVRGGNNQLYSRYSTDNGATWNPANGAWGDLGGSALTTPSAVSWGANRLDVFAGGNGGEIYHDAFNGTSWSWDTLPVVTAGLGRPVAIAHGVGMIDVFAQNSSGMGLSTTTMTGSGTPTTWTSWAEMTSCFRTGGAPAVVSPDGSNLDLVMTSYASNGDAAIWHDSTSGTFPTQNLSQPPACQ